MKDFNLCFIHIEKAAGTTFHDLMLSCLPRYWVLPPQRKRRGFRYDARCLSRMRAILRFDHIGGHALAAFADYESVFPNPFYVSFVRDPAKRYLSHANWLTNKNRPTDQIEDFLANPGMRNGQCFRICGAREFAPARALIEEKNYFIGVSEQFDESVYVLEKLLGLELMRAASSNVTKAENKKFELGQLDKSTHERISEVNSEDLKLYEWVTREHFPAQKQRIGWSNEEFERFTAASRIVKLGRSFYVKKKLKSGVARVLSKAILAGQS